MRTCSRQVLLGRPCCCELRARALQYSAGRCWASREEAGDTRCLEHTPRARHTPCGLLCAHRPGLVRIPAAQEQKLGGASSSDMLKDLAAYLTLEKAQVGRGRMGGWGAAAVRQVAGHSAVTGRRRGTAHTPAGVVSSNRLPCAPPNCSGSTPSRRRSTASRMRRQQRLRPCSPLLTAMRMVTCRWTSSSGSGELPLFVCRRCSSAACLVLLLLCCCDCCC